MMLKESARVAIGAIFALFIIGFLINSYLFYGVFLISLTFIAVDYLIFRSRRTALRSVIVAKSLSRHEIRTGSSAVLMVRLINRSKKILHPYISQPMDPSIGCGLSRRQIALAPGSATLVSVELKPSKYGDFAVAPLQATVLSWFFKDTVPLESTGTLSLRVALGKALIRPSTMLRSTSKYTSLFESFRGQYGGSDFSGMRQYLPGDSVKNIDWTISGKTGDLIVRQYEEQLTMPVFLLVDVDASMCTGKKTELESVVPLAAALIDRLIIDNERVGLICFSRSGIVSSERIGMGRNHVARLKGLLLSARPVNTSGPDPLPSMNAQELHRIGRTFDDSGILGAVIEETLNGYMANVHKDGFSQAVLKVSQSTATACQLVIMTNLSMGMTSLLNGIRLANYYGHRVSVVLTPHIWFESKDLIDVGRYYEEYAGVKDAIMKLRGRSVKVMDISIADRPEDIIYMSGTKGRFAGTRR